MDSSHRSIAAHKRDVDRELHEERVDGPARRNDQSLPIGQLRSPEKSLATGSRINGRFDVCREYFSRAFVSEDQVVTTRFQQRREKVRFQARASAE